MSQTRLRVAPVASPAGFHHVAVASSATATKAPPMPCARVPTNSHICAAAGDAHTTTTSAAIRPRTTVVMLTSIGRMGSPWPRGRGGRGVRLAADPTRRRGGRTLPDENGGGDDRRPQPFLVADGGLRDVLGANDLVREPVDLFLLVPALVGIEFEAQGRGEHFRGELLGVVAGNVFALAEAVMF